MDAEAAVNEVTAAERLRRCIRDSPRQPPEEIEEERRLSHADLKERINQVLWNTLPPTMTMREAEDVACAIFDLIAGSWR